MAIRLTGRFFLIAAIAGLVTAAVLVSLHPTAPAYRALSEIDAVAKAASDLQYETWIGGSIQQEAHRLCSKPQYDASKLSHWEQDAIYNDCFNAYDAGFRDGIRRVLTAEKVYK